MTKKVFYGLGLFFAGCFIALSPAFSGERESKPVDIRGRDYYLALPEDRDSYEAVPLVVCFAGYGVDSGNDVQSWVRPARRMGFAALELTVDYSSIRGPQDLENIHQRVEKILFHHSSILKQGPAYIAGSSAGGMLAIAIGLRYPGQYRAIGIVGGAWPPQGSPFLKHARAKPIYLIHGRDDRQIPYEKLFVTRKILKEHGANVKSLVIPAQGHSLPARVYQHMMDWFAAMES